jgi:di/tricarboxylate transporter
MTLKVLTVIKNYYKFIIIIMAPLLVSVLPIVIQTKEAYCAFVVILMAIYWVTEALPLGITSLLPVVLFPTFGINRAEKVTIGYFKDIVMVINVLGLFY